MVGSWGEVSLFSGLLLNASLPFPPINHMCHFMFSSVSANKCVATTCYFFMRSTGNTYAYLYCISAIIYF